MRLQWYGKQMLLPLICILIWNASLCRSVDQPVDQQNAAGNERQGGMAEQSLDVVEHHLHEEAALTHPESHGTGDEAGPDTAMMSDHGGAGVSASAEMEIMQEISEQGPSVGHVGSDDQLDNQNYHPEHAEAEEDIRDKLNGMSIGGVGNLASEQTKLADHDVSDIWSASSKPDFGDISAGQADEESRVEETGFDRLFSIDTGGEGDQASTVGPAGNGLAAECDHGSGNNLNAGGDGLGVENEPKTDLETSLEDIDSEVSLKKAKEQSKAGGGDAVGTLTDQSKREIAESKSSTDNGQIVHQPSLLPPPPPPVEFAVDPAASESGHTISSSLHVNSGFVRSSNADKIISVINEINAFNRLAESQGVTGRGIYKLREARLCRANNSDVEAQLGGSFDMSPSSPTVYHNEQNTFIQIPVPAAFASISGITGNQQVIIEVMGSLRYLILYNPFAQQFWLVFCASFSDINEEFCQRFIYDDFHTAIQLILEFLIDEVHGQFLLLNQTMFLIVTMLLCHISHLVYGGIHLIDALLRPLLVNHNLDTDMRKSDEYRRPPRGNATRGVQTEDGATSAHAQTGSMQGRIPSRSNKLELWGKLYTSGFDLKMVMKEVSPPEENGVQKDTAKSVGARPKDSSTKGTKKNKKQRKNRGQGNTISSPQQPLQADGPNHSGIPQQSPGHGGAIPDYSLPPEISLPTGQSQTDNTQDKISQGARPKKVSTMTQSKTEEQDPLNNPGA